MGEQAICPVCHQRLEASATTGFLVRLCPQLPPHQSTMLQSLIKAYPNPITTSSLSATLYPYDGPETALACIRQFAFNLRKTLKPLGWTVRGRSLGPNGGGEYALNRLGDT